MSASETQKECLGDLGVMVIDDQRTMRQIVKRLLMAGGVRDVIEADNGLTALEALGNGHIENPDVILCDLHMHGMDGLEFCNTVRRDKKELAEVIPILILTGDDDPLLHGVLKQVGASDVLLKPISSYELVQAVQAAIAEKSSAQVAAADR